LNFYFPGKKRKKITERVTDLVSHWMCTLCSAGSCPKFDRCTNYVRLPWHGKHSGAEPSRVRAGLSITGISIRPRAGFSVTAPSYRAPNSSASKIDLYRLKQIRKLCNANTPPVILGKSA